MASCLSIRVLDVNGKELHGREAIRKLSSVFGPAFHQSNKEKELHTLDLAKFSALSRIKELENKVLIKDGELDQLEQNLGMALESIRSFHAQQNKLFDEFVALREKYDTQKEKLRHILWEYIPNNINKGFEYIPRKETKLTESDNHIGDWHFNEVLGEGQFAIVKSINRTPPNFSIEVSKVAIKRIKKDKITDVKNAKRISNEICNLREMKHPNIVALYEALHTEEYLYLIQERGGKDLFEHFRGTSGPCPEEFALCVMRQVSSALLYMFRKGVVHRDLKPENILVTSHNRVKLIDFGLSTKTQVTMTLDDFCGTPGFFAPEMLILTTYTSEGLDVWSVGCVLLEMILGHHDFGSIWMKAYDYNYLHDGHAFASKLRETMQRIAYMLMGGNKEPHQYSTTSREFLFDLLKIDPKERTTIQELATHPWIAKPKNKTGKVQPSKSISKSEQTTIIQPSKPESDQPDLMEDIDLKQTKNGPRINSMPCSLKNAPQPSKLLLRRQRAKTPIFIETKLKTEKEKSASRSRLPPLSPGSPDVESVNKIVRIGNDLFDKIEIKSQ